MRWAVELLGVRYMTTKTMLAGLSFALALTTSAIGPAVASAVTANFDSLGAAASALPIDLVQDRRGFREGRGFRDDRRFRDDSRYLDDRRYRDRVERGFRYDRRRHGPRYRAYRQGYPYVYEGYYYREPFLNSFRRAQPGVTFGFTVSPRATPRQRGASRHVEWCSNRYRTYDPRTDTFIARVGGPRVRCGSPYR